jgi:hypothetical protein
MPSDAPASIATTRAIVPLDTMARVAIYLCVMEELIGFLQLSHTLVEHLSWQ